MFSFLSYIIEHAYGWLLKLLLLVVIDALFRAFVGPISEPVRIFILYFENLGLFKMFPESSAVFIQSVFILIVTWEVLIWVVGRHHLPQKNQSQPVK